MGCGTVLRERMVDEGADWRNFADGEKDRSRVGMMESSNTELSTHLASGGSHQNIVQLHNKTTIDSKTRNLMEASDSIENLASIIKADAQVQKKAIEIYTDYERVRKKTTRTGNHKPLIVAILYMACNQQGVGRTIKELSLSTGVPKNEIRKNCTALNKILPQKNDTALSADSLIDRFCSKIPELPEWLKSEAASIARKVTPELEGKQPSSIAAASIFMACKIASFNLTEETIASATSSITSNTVKNTYKLMIPFQQKIVSETFFKKIQS